MNTQENASAGSQKSENKKNHNITKQDVTCPWISVITVTQNKLYLLKGKFFDWLSFKNYAMHFFQRACLKHKYPGNLKF